MTKDIDLYNALCIYTENIIRLLDKEGFYRNGRWSLDIKNHPVFDKIFQLKETSLLVDMLISKEIIKKPEFIDNDGNLVKDPSRKNINWSGIVNRSGILKFIMEYMEITQSLKINKEIFDDLYNDFEKYSIYRVLNIHSIIPLLNFSSDIDIIEFDNDIKIVRVDKNEITNKLCYLDHIDEKDIIENYLNAEFAIDIRFSLSRDDDKFSGYISHDKAKQVITVLRLIKKGDPRWNVIFSGYEGFHSAFKKNSLSAEFTIGRDNITNGKYFLINSDLEDCKKIFDDLEKIYLISDKGGLDIGIRKFNEIYDRKLLEDKLLDMSTILDTTLLANLSKDERGEKTFRICLRGAELLKNIRNRKETFDLLKKLYNARSRIIHDGERCSREHTVIRSKDGILTVGERDIRHKNIKINSEKLFPNDFVNKSEGICREIIRTFLDKISKGENIGDIARKLDVSLLD